MIDLSKCKSGDILICKHGVIKEYVRPTTEEDIPANFYDHYVKYLYIPFKSILSIEHKDDIDGFVQSEGTVCNDGFVFRISRLESDSDVIKVVDREVFKRYLRMLSYKL